MSITSAKSGGTGISLALDNNYMEPIASTLVGSGGVNSIIFNDIPQTYKHIQLRGIVRTDRAANADNIVLRFNSDNGTNYTVHQISGDGATASAYGAASQTKAEGVFESPAASATSGIFGAGVIDILDYSNTNKYKTIRALNGTDRNGAGQVNLRSNLWMNNNAVTSITLTPLDGLNFVQYSRVSLYGIKG